MRELGGERVIERLRMSEREGEGGRRREIVRVK